MQQCCICDEVVDFVRAQILFKIIFMIPLIGVEWEKIWEVEKAICLTKSLSFIMGCQNSTEILHLFSRFTTDYLIFSMHVMVWISCGRP